MVPCNPKRAGQLWPINRHSTMLYSFILQNKYYITKKKSKNVNNRTKNERWELIEHNEHNPIMRYFFKVPNKLTFEW